MYLYLDLLLKAMNFINNNNNLKVTHMKGLDK